MTNKGTRVERRTLADGTLKEYHYQRTRRIAPRERTVRAVIGLWQQSVEWDNLRPNTRASYVLYIDPLFEALKDIPLVRVKRRHLMAIRDSVAKRRGHGAAATFCRVVSAFFSWAIDREYLEGSPASKLGKSLRHGSLPTWTEEQAQAAIRHLPEPFRRAVVLAYHTGQRRGDLCAMRWSDYSGQTIRLCQQKTLEPLEIRASAALRAELDAWKQTARTTTVLASSHGRPFVPVALSRNLSKALVRIGLPKGLNLHGLRKLAAVRLAEVGCSIHEIAAITGHRTLAMVQLYTKGVNQRRLAEVASLRLDHRDKEHKRPLLPVKSTRRPYGE